MAMDSSLSANFSFSSFSNPALIYGSRNTNSDADSFNNQVVKTLFILEILQLFPHGRFLIIEDLENERNLVSDVLKRVSQHSLGYSVLTCNSEEQVYYNILLSLLKIEVPINLLIFCSENATLKFLQKVVKKKMFFRHANWFVYSNSAIIKQLQDILEEGVRVVLAFDSKPGRYEIHQSKVTREEKIRFINAGFAKAKSSKELRIRTKGQLFPDLISEYQDFGGRTLTVSSLSGTLAMTLEVLPSGKIVGKQGLDYEILKSFSQNMNFDLSLSIPKDKRIGDVLANGSSTGIIGEVIRREKHFGAITLSVTYEREQLLDFLMPSYFQDSFQLLQRAPLPKEEFFAALRPLPVEVWIISIIIIIVTAPLLTLMNVIARKTLMTIDSEDSNHNTNVLTTYVHLYGAFLGQGDMPVSKWTSVRLASLCLFICSMLLRVIYSGVLTSYLVMPSYERPVDSLHDLFWANEKGYIVGSTKESTMWLIFQDATEGLYKEVYGLFKGEESHCDFYYPTLQACVLSKKYLYIIPEIHGKHFTAKMGREKFYVGKEAFYSHPLSIACSAGAPYVSIFNKRIGQLIDSGITDKWLKHYLFLETIRAAYTPKAESGESDKKALSLRNLKSLFIIYAIGIILSVVCFAAEIFVYNITSKN